MSTFNLQPPVLQPNLGIMPPTGTAFVSGCTATAASGGGVSTPTSGQIFPTGRT